MTNDKRGMRNVECANNGGCDYAPPDLERWDLVLRTADYSSTGDRFRCSVYRDGYPLPAIAFRRFKISSIWEEIWINCAKESAFIFFITRPR